MRSLLIPFLYIYKNTVIYRRAVKVNDKIIFKVKIFYKLDTFTYKTVSREFNSEDTIFAKVNKTVETIIDELNKQFK